jgi:hypothetical protein
LLELLDLARKEFNASNQSGPSDPSAFLDEKALEREWPPLRAQLSAAVRAWRIKGLELMGVPDAAPIINLPLVSVAPTTIQQGEPTADVSDDPVTRPTRNTETPVFTRRAKPIEDLTIFAGLPLFDL